MSVSKARELIRLAGAEPDRLQRHLYVAAALREALSDDPVVVGGTAEEYWTRAAYHETDLDLCAALTTEDAARLVDLGFVKSNRHWELQLRSAIVAVEFPDTRIDGDESRTVEHKVGPGRAQIIGPEDLYIDRLVRSTATEFEGLEFMSALAVASAALERLDWGYVKQRTDELTAKNGRLLGEHLKRNDSKIKRRVRRELSRPR